MTVSFPDLPMAVFSPCRQYRYFLKRSWDPLFHSEQFVAFLCLNPSTADESTNDNTVVRCIGFAKAWGYSALAIINIFAFRATRPANMLAHHDPVGDENDGWIKMVAESADMVIAAWGNNGAHLERSAEIKEMFHGLGVGLHCLSVTLAGHPEHPLYLRSDLIPMPYRG